MKIFNMFLNRYRTTMTILKGLLRSIDPENWIKLDTEK